MSVRRTFGRELTGLIFGTLLFLCCSKESVVGPEKVLDEKSAGMLIEEILAGNKKKYGTFQKNVLVSLGKTGGFRVDYIVEKNGGTTAIINYIGETDNSEKEFSNQRVLQGYSIPNIYFGASSEDEIVSGLNAFIKRGFN